MHFGLNTILHYGCEICHYPREAVNRHVILGFFDLCFAQGFGGALGWGDDGVAQLLSRLFVVFFKQDWSQVPTHVPFHVICEHTHEDVRSNAVRETMVDWSDFQINALTRSEGPLHV